jgi:nucleotide-binding universal stress UspA family protein
VTAASPGQTALICYDGSDDARAAIQLAGAILRPGPVAVLTVWQPFVDVLAHTPAGFGLAAGIPDIEEIDAATRKSAEERAEEGQQLAVAAGLEAQAMTCQQEGTVADTIAELARKIDVPVIVMGSRGLTGLKSMLLGSVSHAVLQRADRAVVVVPSPKVAAARAHARSL